MVRYYLKGKKYIIISTLSEDIIDLEEFDEPLEYDSFAVDTEEINQDDEESEYHVENWTDPKAAFHDTIIIDDEKDDNLTEISAIEIEEWKVSLEERKLKLKQYEIDLKYKELQIKKWKWR
ncbi:unnamed protein product [Rhizophagus irregularis]|uniref:Uncharacterized protein n=1 Tax=Rhizophagus irregularis TaxID=588596 RepID=A0A916EIP6_9GLOM|nr:unnamed protein product [Rhizophagus irregularis]CAB5391553.1 unnamed protein product [Rhizophagus irregularis]